MGIKEVAVNKKARFDYFIEETVEAGISLSGAEVKSAKMGHINVADSFCFIENGGITLKNLREYAECGVDFISVGALTHQIKSLDLSLKACKAGE